MIDWIFPFIAVLVPLIGALVVALAGRTEKTAGMIAGAFGVITAITTLMLLTRITDKPGRGSAPSRGVAEGSPHRGVFCR